MDQPTSKEPRGPVSLRIKFRSASLDQFIERYAVDVSRGGIFIRTREPLAVGTPLRFDFQLQDGSALLAGEGTIVWIRENDPSRAGVTPGMGVRFDKLSSTSQPVLEKILAEKARREQAGAPAKPAPGGIAVRRPSSTFSALDPAAARAAQATSTPPRVGGLSPLGAQPRAAAAPAGSAPLAPGAQPRTAAPAGGSGPLGSQPRTTAPAIGSDAFGTGRAPGASGLPRTSENPIPAGVPGLEGSGAFGRPRATTGSNAQRPAPAPAALFEKPTADDIDRALSVLTEVDGPPPSFGQPEEPPGHVRRPTDAQPVVLEAAPDVGTAPVAAHRRQTDAQPVVLEASPDVGEAPARKSTGTRPLFTGTGETKIPTVPVATLGDGAFAGQDEDEDDATSAWVGSGPTRAGGSDPELPAAAAAPPKEATQAATKAATAKAPATKVDEPAAPPAKAPELVKAPPAPALDAAALPAKAPSEPPIIMTPNFVAPKPAAKKGGEKKGSSAPVVIVGVLVAAAAAGGGFLYLKGSNRAPAPESPPTAVAPPEGAPTPPAAAEGTAPSPAPGTAGAPSAAEKPAQPENAAPPAPSAGGTATPSTLRLRPEGEAPPAQAAPAAAEAKPDDKAAEKAAEAKERRHRRRREESAAENTAPEKAAEPAKTEPAAAPAEAAAPAAAEAKAPAASGHLLKITSSPAGAEVIIDGTSVGTTPFSNGDVDPALPHSVTIKKDGFEAYEHMIGGSDWPQPKKGVRTLKLNAKLRATGGANETAKPAEPAAPSEPPPGLGTTPASPKRE
jgi:uncharacterized protein (TIGR02266 family)